MPNRHIRGTTIDYNTVKYREQDQLHSFIYRLLLIGNNISDDIYTHGCVVRFSTVAISSILWNRGLTDTYSSDYPPAQKSYVLITKEQYRTIKSGAAKKQ